jgi:hypothetical protein
MYNDRYSYKNKNINMYDNEHYPQETEEQRRRGLFGGLGSFEAMQSFVDRNPAIKGAFMYAGGVALEGALGKQGLNLVKFNPDGSRDVKWGKATYLVGKTVLRPTSAVHTLRKAGLQAAEGVKSHAKNEAVRHGAGTVGRFNRR